MANRGVVAWPVLAWLGMAAGKQSAFTIIFNSYQSHLRNPNSLGNTSASLFQLLLEWTVKITAKMEIASKVLYNTGK